MGKIGFNCQLLLSEIGLTTDSSHSTWFHKIIRFSRSKASSEEDLAQHVLFDTGRRRTRLGILKKIEESEPSQDDTDQPLLLAPKILPFPKELELHLFSISIQEFLGVSTPPKNGQIPFLSNTYKIRHYKKDNGNPTINYFIYEFHSNRNACPTETKFVTCYPLT